MFRVLLILLFAYALPGFAQPTGGSFRDTARFRAMMKDSSFMRNIPATGKVIGTIRDSLTRKPVEFASVALFRVRDSSVAGGALSDDKGQFRIEELTPGRYFIRISSIGYRKLDSKPFMLTPAEPLKDFREVFLSSSVNVLKEAEVVGEKLEYVNSLDKKVYNVDKNLVNAGGSVSEVLQNIPSVNVDIDGRISLRGSEGVTILIDGKPAGLTGENRGAILQQLPAGSIEQIEVITNPSAKYDAEGMSGIINIKTRKDKNAGLNGTVSAGVGTRDKYNASLNLNRRTKTNNAYVNYNFRDDRRFSNGTSLRTNTFGDNRSYIDSENDGRNHSVSHVVRAGIDLYLNDYNTLGFAGSYNNRSEDRRDLATNLFQDADRNTFSGFERLTRNDEQSRLIDGSVDYRRTFPGSKRELTASASLNNSRREEEQRFTSFPLLGPDLIQRVFTDNMTYNGVAQVDYVLPKEKYKLEGGLKTTFRTNDGTQNSDRFEQDVNLWVEDSFFRDRFIFEEWVYAGYVQWAGRWKVFDLSAGLRGEQTLINGDSRSADTTFTRDFFNLFPSGAIKYSFSEGKDVQLSYSRRINRPRERELNPFRNVSDSINIFVGNPGILPELTHSLELGYTGRYKEQSVSASVFYRYSENNSQRFRTIDTISNITTQSFVNYASSQNLGFELVFRNSFLKIFTSSLNFTLFYNQVDGTNIGPGLTSEVWSGDVRASLSAKFSKSTSVQLTGNYMMPREQPQGTFQGMNGVDFGLRHEFKGGKWSVNLSITDIFDTRNFDIDNRGDGFRVEAIRKRETRIGTITLNYRFGKAEQQRDRRRQNRGNESSPMNDMMDF